MTQTSDAPRHIIKRYAGTRLYDTATLSYVTPNDIRALLRTNADVAVHDAETGADIIRSVLLDHQ